MNFFSPIIAHNPFFLVAVLILSIFIIWKSSNWLVDSACSIAFRLSVSPLVIGLTIVAIGTSAPEFAVSIGSALKGNTDIAVGNIFGSNIFNLGFILGISAIFSNIKTNWQTVYQSGGFLVLSVGLIYFLIFGFSTELKSGYLSPLSSIFMLLLLISYTFFLYLKKESTNENPKRILKGSPLCDILWLVLGLVGVMLGAHFLVESSINLGKLVGLSDWIIGITIVAIGTSFPELVISIAALLKKEKSIVIGNLIGSDLFNILGVLGVAGIVSQGVILSPAIQFSFIILFLNLIIVFFFLRTSWKLSTWEGIVLILIACFRYLFNFS